MRLLAFSVLVHAGFAAAAPFVRAEDAAAPLPIVIDEAAPELRDVRPRLWGVAFAPNGKSLAVVGGWDNPKEPGELVVWDIEGKRPLLIWRQDRPVPCVAYSSDGRLIAIGDFAGTARILDAASGKTLATLPKHDAIINAVAFLPGGKTLVTGCFDGVLTFWNVEAKKERPNLIVPGEQVVGLAASADGKYLAATTWEGNVHVWEVAGRKLLHKQRAIVNEGRSASGVAQAVAFAPDGASFVTGSADHSVRLFSSESGKEIRSFAGHTNPVANVAIAPDGETLVSSDWRGTLRFWSVKSGELIEEVAAHRSACFGLAFSPDGKQLATSSLDRTVKIWDVKSRRETATLTRVEPARE
jgi:WD40 repeat protein